VRAPEGSATVLVMVDTAGRSSMGHADESQIVSGGRRRWWRDGELPGTEPDARFTFANERTFLAWNRTALGCVVAGLAVSHVLKPAEGSNTGPKIAGLALMILGGLLALFSHSNWAASQLALRLGRPLPRSPLPMLVSIVTAVVAVAAALYTLF
jgi:putative membrane protein